MDNKFNDDQRLQTSIVETSKTYLLNRHATKAAHHSKGFEFENSTIEAFHNKHALKS